MGDIAVGGINNVRLTGREDAPVLMLAHGFGCDQNREPDRFSKLILLGPSPRYVDDQGYQGGFSAADIGELLDSLDSNYLGWSAAMAPVIMGNPDRPELGEELTNSFCRTDPEIARSFASAA